MVLDASLLNTQEYKVHIKSKVEQSRERSSTLPYPVVAIEMGAFWSPSTKATNFTYISSHLELSCSASGGAISQPLPLPTTPQYQKIVESGSILDV